MKVEDDFASCLSGVPLKKVLYGLTTTFDHPIDRFCSILSLYLVPS